MLVGSKPILPLNCRLQVEQVSVKESAGDPLVLACSLCHTLHYSAL